MIVKGIFEDEIIKKKKIIERNKRRETKKNDGGVNWMEKKNFTVSYVQ